MSIDWNRIARLHSHVLALLLAFLSDLEGEKIVRALVVVVFVDALIVVSLNSQVHLIWQRRG